MNRTQRNKATNAHLGILKAKLAKLRRELITPKVFHFSLFVLVFLPSWLHFQFQLNIYTRGEPIFALMCLSIYNANFQNKVVSLILSAVKRFWCPLFCLFQSGGGPKEEGFDVAKTGDARIGFVGPYI